MPLYSYSARNAKGERIQGSIDAPDIRSARIALAEQALVPEEVFQISFDAKGGGMEYTSTSLPEEQKAQQAPAPVAQAPAPTPQPEAKPIEKAEQPKQVSQERPVQKAHAAPPSIPLSSPAGQSAAVDWKEESKKMRKEAKGTATEERYYPFTDTLRLYAGWLLAWYALVYALGSYQANRSLPFEIPYLPGIYSSPLVLSFTLAAFLFLLFTAIYRASGKGAIAALLCTIAGVLAFVFYRVNV